MATFDNYSENGLPTEAVIVPGVSPEALKPDQPSVQPEPVQRQFAIPTVAEKQAWRQAAMRDVSPVTGMINQVADDLAKTNPAGAENLRKLGELYRQNLQEQEEERAWRLGEMKAARAAMDRMQEASQRRSAREYDDQDPSWASVFVDNPIVANTIGKRRYNPYTGEIEHHYPRNVAEGVGNVVEHLPELAHAFFTGNNSLQQHNRAVDEYNMLGPYERQNASIEAYRTGRMVEPGNTALDALSEMYTKAKAERENDAAAIEDLYRLSGRVGQMAGAPAGTAFFRTKLGLPIEANTTSYIDDIIKDPTVSMEQLNAAAAQLLENITKAGSESEAKAAYASYQKVIDEIRTRKFKNGEDLDVTPLGLEQKKDLGKQTRKKMKGFWQGHPIGEIPAENIEALRKENGDLNVALEDAQNKIQRFIDQGTHSKEEIKAYAKAVVESYEALKAAKQRPNRWEAIGTGAINYLAPVALGLLGNRYAGKGMKAAAPAANKVLNSQGLRQGAKAVAKDLKGIPLLGKAAMSLAKSYLRKGAEAPIITKAAAPAAKLAGRAAGFAGGWQLGDKVINRILPWWPQNIADSVARDSFTEYLVEQASQDPAVRLEALKQMARQAQEQQIQKKQTDPMSSVDTTGTGT